MKHFANFVLVMLIYIYNIPILFLLIILSLWHWEESYISEYWNGFSEGLDKFKTYNEE